ncbi:C-X-C chemokine receptor type 2-like [Genypterus blacodes]|uniref:C-X-C chemokine receptor type 2-like n=1 Tax=Genypterus blacodes TaxID=154954 RepID=UPI003F76CFE5
MSFTFDIEDWFDLLNDTIQDNYSRYIPDPKTLSCETKPPGFTASLALCIIYMASFLLAIPGNVLVGWVIGISRRALTPSDVYLIHLTIADGLLVLTLPFWAIAAIQGWIFGDFMCKVLSLTIEANFYTSIIFLACISIDRYIAIVHASESRNSRQQRCSWAACASVWVLGCTLALPALFNDAFRIEPDSDTMTCSERFDFGSATSWRTATRGFRHIFGFGIPLIIMVTCYSITIARLLRTRGFHKHRAMRVIIAVVIVFMLCWTPYHMAMVADMLLRAELVLFTCAVRTSLNAALPITHGLALLHCCINPVLYAFVGEKFRNKLKKLLQRKLRQERTSGSRFSRSTSQTSDGTGAFL